MADTSYRKHWLINALGERYDFTDKNSKVFLSSPQGFGFQREYSSMAVGNSELVTSQRFVLTDITGELLFYENGVGEKYEDYQEFIQFVKFKPIEFHYQTPNQLESYHCDVLFVQASKSEVDSDNIMRVPVVFHRLTEWLTDEDKVYSLDNSPIDEGKYHNLIYNYHYAGTNLSNSIIVNDGTDDIGFILEVIGTVQNPQFTLTQNGEIYGICKINGNYDYVMIDSVERSEQIYLELNGAAITNPERYQDFTIRNGASYLTWCKLKVGETLFSFTCGNIDTFNGEVKISFKNSYATV